MAITGQTGNPAGLPVLALSPVLVPAPDPGHLDPMPELILDPMPELILAPMPELILAPTPPGNRGPMLDPAGIPDP